MKMPARAVLLADAWPIRLTPERSPSIMFDININSVTRRPCQKLTDLDDFVSAVHGLLQSGSSVSIPSIAITPRRPI
jgi:hypothetical protein